ncbi:MAG: hypothetical protein Q8O35_07760 [Humidesulfovibrio sp.]|uniref:hypothetical protein n=1 Tax=Humidesulfovibrio sp. TaxID=2910988 RepID=UPI0027328818|nr:hypothetical protein [Humidesulfovibrio sp.]MDP2848073.1 hypothetical protein [Humidesulfovibrio sp.]
MPKGSDSGVVRLPAFGCRFYHLGRCLYEEQLNPGFHTAWRCSVQVRWEAVYDDFLSRAESFDLNETELLRLWRLRFERLAEEPIDCPGFSLAQVETLPECLHLLVDICLLRLPACAGHCTNYRLHPKA